MNGTVTNPDPAVVAVLMDNREVVTFTTPGRILQRGQRVRIDWLPDRGFELRCDL